MTIEQIDKARVLISLKPQDMDAYAISIDKLNIKDAKSKEALKELLKLALKEAGISTENKAVLIEAMPHNEGMIILVTVDFIRNIRKIYRIKKPRMLPCCKFDSAESLLSCVERAKSEKVSFPGNSLWQYKNAFYVIFGFSGISPKAKAVLSEYAVCYSISLARVARIKEAGKELVRINAMEKISEAMDEAVV